VISRTIFVAFLGIGLITLAAACGDDDATSSSTASPNPSPTVDVSALPIPAPWELYVAATDGSGDHLVYSSENFGQYASAPDGSRVAISESNGTDSTTVRILSLDGVETGSFVHKGYPNKMIWSPDGRSIIAAFSENASTDSLIAADAESGEQRELLRSPNNTYSYLLGWFAGSELRVIQATNATSDGELLAVNVETGASRQLSDLIVAPNYYSDRAISPDGKQIAIFASVSSDSCPGTDHSSAVFTINIETGASAQVTQDVYCSGGDLIWSADGKQIAYLTFDLGGGTATLSAVDVASHQSRALTSGLNEPVAWLADGTILANKLFCTGCDGGGPPRVFAIDSETGQANELTGAVPSAISVSGRIVAADGALKEINARGESVATLAQIESNWQYGSMTWSRDEKYVAYGRSRAQGEHYFEVNADGSGYGWTASYDGTTKPSPDGTRIAYLTNEPLATEKGISHLWLADADGSNAKQVPVDGSVGAYSWSPDSTRIMFSNVDVATGSAVESLVNADGSGVRPVGTGNVVVDAKSGVPVWSPNGKLAMFFDDPISVIDVETGESREFPGGGPKGTAAWSPDSTQIIYSSFVVVPASPRATNQIHSNLYILDVASGATTAVPGDNTQKSGFAMSPDGQQIAYVRALSGSKESELRAVNVDGSDDHFVLTGASSNTAPAWSPDGSRLAASVASNTSSGIFVVRADGSEAKQITRGVVFDSLTWLDNNRLRFSTFIGGL
jgi:Tol biopolymer transport system component